MTGKVFEEILNDCLERLLIKGESIESCLAAYPQHADTLKPLLETSFAAQQQAAAIEPSAEFRARARYQFRAELQQMKAGKKSPFSFSSSFSFWRMRWATALTAVLVMLMASSGLVAAAGSSMPDNPLYSLKMAVEQAQLSLTFSDSGKANLYAKFADKRVDEIIYMAQKGDIGNTETTACRLNESLAMIASLNSTDDGTPGGDNGDSLSEGGRDTVTKSTNTETVSQAGVSVTTACDSTILPAINLPAPEVTVAPPPITVVPPDLSFDATAEVPGVITVTKPPPVTVYWDDSMYELFDLLLQDSADNSAALYDLLANAPDEMKPVIEQVIAILESGYYNAINSIGG